MKLTDGQRALFALISLNDFSADNLINYLARQENVIPLIPHFNLGRQKGNSFAARRFIEINPYQKFCVFTPAGIDYRRDYGALKNSFGVFLDGKAMEFRGMQVDYLIFDAASYSMQKYLEYIVKNRDNILPALRDTKIFSIG